MVVTTSSKKGWLEEYLAVEDLREFPYLLFVIRFDFCVCSTVHRWRKMRSGRSMRPVHLVRRRS